MVAITELIKSSDKLTDAEKDLIVPCGYGHMADGDIQMSITALGTDESSALLRDKVVSLIDDFIVEFVGAKGGSISGEHGIGLQRVH